MLKIPKGKNVGIRMRSYVSPEILHAIHFLTQKSMIVNRFGIQFACSSNLSTTRKDYNDTETVVFSDERDCLILSFLLEMHLSQAQCNF